MDPVPMPVALNRAVPYERALEWLYGQNGGTITAGDLGTKVGLSDHWRDITFNTLTDRLVLRWSKTSLLSNEPRYRIDKDVLFREIAAASGTTVTALASLQETRLRGAHYERAVLGHRDDQLGVTRSQRVAAAFERSQNYEYNQVGQLVPRSSAAAAGQSLSNAAPPPYPPPAYSPRPGGSPAR